MKRVLLLLSISCAVAALGLIVSPSTVLAAASCEWCHIDFCGGTSVCNHECSDQEGDSQLEDCQEYPDGCEGDNECWNEEQQLPDQTTVALVRDCALSPESAGVVADAWRGLYHDASVRPEEMALVGAWGG